MRHTDREWRLVALIDRRARDYIIALLLQTLLSVCPLHLKCLSLLDVVYPLTSFKLNYTDYRVSSYQNCDSCF